MNSEEYDHISHYLSDNVYPQSILQLKNCRHVKKTFRVKASQYQLGENDKIFKVISNSILNCMYITHNTVEHYGHFVLLTVPGNVKLIKLVLCITKSSIIDISLCENSKFLNFERSDIYIILFR